MDEGVISRAEGFMMHAAKYKFGSQDALLAATCIIHSSDEMPMMVVTSDRALRAAMAEEGVRFLVPGSGKTIEVTE